jgi:methyl-accepting chemotaxis protein
VKALASQTTAATNEIAAQIEHIQAAGGSAVAAIREVDQIISAMNGTSLAVAAAMEEQGVATQEIARNVQHAAQGTRQVSGSMQAVKGAAGEAGQAANRVLEAARDLARHSGEIERELQGFLDEMQAA